MKKRRLRIMEITSEKPDVRFNATGFLGITLSELRDFLIKNYLYKCYIGEIVLSNLKVTKILGLNTIDSPIPGKLTVNHDLENNCYRISEVILFISVVYEGEHYEISTRREYEFAREQYMYKLHISGVSEAAVNTTELFELIDRESIKSSSFRNNVAAFNLLQNSEDTKVLLENLEIVKPKNTNLSNLFIPNSKKIQLNRFIYAVKNYKNDKLNLRYLLSGVPGTGKTDIINAIVNEIRGNATVLLAQGGSLPIKEIVEFCSMFEPCILIIDDIDFLIGERDKNYDNRTLGAFLQLLDGFLPSNIFLLASTNDKKLVDLAASRPGRFDLILDVSEIEAKNYLDLVKRETDIQEILKFFDDNVIESLKSKKVTGAFIVSLIKQLNSHLLMNGELSFDEFNEYLDTTHKGFYSNNSDNIIHAVGF